MAYKRLIPWETTEAQARFVKRFKELAGSA